jgi:2-amino-4-hydroxy-6-hydroxymethyldihydropteridine diphosphokinase
VTLVYVGLGANLGQPIVTINLAESRLGDLPGVTVLRRASLYRTAPQGVTDQPDFINTVVEISTDAEPAQLITWFKAIEVELGRVPAARWGPRVIDLDLLLYGEVGLGTPELTVPHAAMWNRLFVLAPLSELRPDLLDPSGRSIRAVCDALSGEQRVQRLEVD